MKSVKKGDIIHTSVEQKVKDINTCKTIIIPMESEIQIIKKEKIQTVFWKAEYLHFIQRMIF